LASTLAALADNTYTSLQGAPLQLDHSFQQGENEQDKALLAASTPSQEKKKTKKKKKRRRLACLLI
jgi:hypothetical protein